MTPDSSRFYEGDRELSGAIGISGEELSGAIGSYRESAGNRSDKVAEGRWWCDCAVWRVWARLGGLVRAAARKLRQDRPEHEEEHDALMTFDRL